MTNKPKQFATSPLIEAAATLEGELTRLNNLAEEAQRLPLTSRKNLEKTMRVLQDLGGTEERLEPAVRALMGAVAALTERQGGQAEALRARAEEVQARQRALQELFRRYLELGKKASDFNLVVQKFAEDTRRGMDSGGAPDQGEIARLLAEMDKLGEESGTLAKDAADQQFQDVAIEVDAVQKQVMAARNRLALFSGRLQQQPASEVVH
jgi:predicted  nucleic acid-binding Zn-ribbon protein